MAGIPYGRQDINQEDIDAVVKVLQEDFITQGPRIASFEASFAKYIGSKYAVAVSNGTAALHLSAMVLGVQSGSKVITSPITFASSANCIRFCGGEVVFADIDPETALLDVDEVRKLLKASPKGTYQGIVPVDFAGLSVNMEAFRDLANEYDLFLLEDACHAPGGAFLDSKGVEHRCGDGSLADAAIFSFHPVKHIATGEGGMITTNSKELYDRLLVLRTHGITKDPEMLKENHGGWYYEMVELGYNYRITDFQCALGISQLERAAENVRKRQAIAAKYDQAFKGSKVKPLKVSENYSNAYHLYVIQVQDRKGLYDHLRANEVYAQVHYIPLHLQPYYREQGYKKGDFPKAEAYYDSCLSIPLFPTLTADEQARVIELILTYTS